MLLALILVSVYAAIVTGLLILFVDETRLARIRASKANKLLDTRYEEGRMDEYHFLMRLTHRKGAPSLTTAWLRTRIPAPDERRHYEHLDRQVILSKRVY